MKASKLSVKGLASSIIGEENKTPIERLSRLFINIKNRMPM